MNRSSRSSTGPPERPDRGGRVLRADLVSGQPLEDPLTAGVGGLDVVRRRDVLVGAGSEAQRPDERFDARPDGRVGDPELPLDVAEVAARAKEALEERGLLATESREPADGELALERRPAGRAAKPGDGELAGADGAGGDHVVCHAFLFWSD